MVIVIAVPITTGLKQVHEAHRLNFFVTFRTSTDAVTTDNQLLTNVSLVMGRKEQGLPEENHSSILSGFMCFYLTKHVG